jgi:hypothetical protein
MFIALIAITALICVLAPLVAYFRYRDLFHPTVLVAPMCGFLYVYMPVKLIKSDDLFNFVSNDQAVFYQLLIVLVLAALFAGMLAGSGFRASDLAPRILGDKKKLHNGAYFFGFLGFLAFAYTVHNVGGISAAFGGKYGGGWSTIGYVRDAAYLTIVGMILLLSPEAFDPKNKFWKLALLIFATPWLAYSLLGTRRGPTFMVTVCIGMSWYMARGKRPSIFMLLAGGTALGLLMLFLVSNRDHICLKCDLQLTTDVSNVTEAVTEGNEYIFGTGCVAASRVTGDYFWGRRYLAQVTIRAIPSQIWPTKYEDMGMGMLRQNAGVAGPGLMDVMGWGEIPGAAATMVADMWVEFSWLELPVAFVIGWAFGRVWRLAIMQIGFWMTEYIILCVLSIYFVTQSGEAVISRFVILSVPALIVWRRAQKNGRLVPVGAASVDIQGTRTLLHA